MKTFLMSLAVLSAVNCGDGTKEVTNKEEAPTTASTEVVAEDQHGILVGPITKDDLMEVPHKAWFEPAFTSYQPAPQALETIEENIDDYTVKLFMGTWCSDSKRETPKFLKILELVDYDMDKLDIFAVRRDKTLPDDAQQEYDIQYVPTIIFYKDGKEVDRFVEYPQENFEADIAAIVSGEDYKHSYE